MIVTVFRGHVLLQLQQRVDVSFQVPIDYI